MSKKSHLSALFTLVCVLTAFAVPATASAAINVSVGIGDQSENLFDDANFKKLRVKKTRYFIKWDAVDRPGEIAQADAYVNAAQRNRADVLMHISSNNLSIKAAELPSVAEYRDKVQQLIDRYRPKGVKTWGAFNEANHASQPTWDNPKRAAQYFLEMRKICTGCKIIALDVLDQRGVDKYINRFFSALGSRKRIASTIGVHNYSDTNRYRNTGTKLILKTVKRNNPRAKFWLTETGAVVKFGSSFRCSASNPGPAERRAAKAIDYMFKLVKDFRRDFQRLYIYNFFGDACQGRFDAGIVKSNSDPDPRPAYERVRRQMKNFKR
jgi:hypothetical protein